MYKKIQKPRAHDYKLDYKNSNLVFGTCGLKTIEGGRISLKQLDAVRKFLQKKLKRRGKVLFTVICDKSVTKKPAEVRMGKGKGGFSHWVCVVKKGRILFEIFGSGLSVTFLCKTLLEASMRLSVKTRILLAKS